MPNYKIEFTLKTPCSFTALPTFDALVAWCMIKRKKGEVYQPINISPEDVETFDDMPIVRHENGYFMASWMQFDASESKEFITSKKKRWASEMDWLVDFGGKVEKVRVNAGEFKAYEIPVNIRDIRNVWFFFVSDDVERVRDLIGSHLVGIGKYSSKGEYGLIYSFQISEIDYDPFVNIIRPIPASAEDVIAGRRVQRISYRPPYWLESNFAYCLKP